MYRIFESKDNNPHTLFHGIDGTRKLPLDVWVESDTKQVSDGSRKTSKLYKSGFHVMLSLEDIIKFSSRFRIRKFRFICAVEVDVDAGIWDKKHSNSQIKLVKRLRIPSEYWNNRFSLENIE